MNNIIDLSANVTGEILDFQNLVDKKISKDAYYNAILDSIQDSVFTVDKELKIINANKIFRERTFAITGLEIRPGETIFKFGKNQQVIDSTIACILKAMNGEAFVVDSEFLLEGKKLYRQATFTPIWEGDSVIGVCCYSKDTSSTHTIKEELNVKETLFKTLLENTHDGIAMLSAGGRLKYISPSVGRILGYTFKEIVETGMADLVHPDDLDSLNRFREKLVPLYGKSDHIEFRLWSKKGEWKWLHCHYTNLLHEPSIKAMVVNYEDITEKMALEVDLAKTVQDLVEADERQSSIINSLRANIALLDKHGVIVEVNEAWKQFADENHLISKNYGIGDNYIDISERAACDGEQTGVAVANGIRAVLAGEMEEFSLEYTCHSKTEKRWFNVIVYPLYKKSRSGVVVYHVNISDRKLADLQVDFHRRNRDALINSTKDLMWSFDANMQLITANDSFIAVVKAVGNIDMKPGDYMIPPEAFSIEDQMYWANNYKRALSGEHFIDVVNRNIPHEFWTEVSFNPMWENGKVIGVACYSRDITERKKSERLILQNQQMMADAESIAHFGSWELDFDDPDNMPEGCLRWSDEVSRIFGYEPGAYEVTNDNFFKAVHPDDRALIRNSVQKAISEKNNYSLSHRILRPNGEVRWVHEEARIVINETTGNPVKMIGTVLDITERKASEEKLKEAERNYREIFDKASDAIFIHDLETGRAVDVNSKACEIIGFTKEEILDVDPTVFMADTPGSTLSDAMDYMMKAVTEGPQLFEFHSKRKDGTLYWNEVNLSLATIAGTERILAFFRNIDDRKHAEENLRKSEARYRQIVETAQEGIWILDENNRTTYVNNKMCEILEYPREEMMGKQNFDFMNEEMKQVAMSAIERRKLGNSDNFDHQFVTKTGRNIWTSLSASPLKEPNGKYIGALAMVTDITDRKLAEESLHKSEANLRTIFDHADRAFVLLDKDFNILSFNSVANEYAKLFYKAEFQEGESMISYLEADRKEEGKRILASVLTGKVNDHEMQFPMKDGSTKWFRIRRYPVRNDKGDILGICIATKDSTRRKNFEIERDKLTAEIVQRNKDLEQFAYIVSHNLRAPVANIIGFSDALLHMALDEAEEKDMLDGLDISIKRLDNVIFDLNKILQVKNELDLSKETVNFSELINDIILSIANIIEKENVTINTDFSQVDEMFTQKTYLYSIFFNLISNSIKYRKPNLFPVIEIESRRLDGKIEMSIKDNGLGIDLQKKNGQIFGLYKRFHPHVAEGKGMGLFMVKTQVERLGGKITIDSEVNVGTVFRIIFDC